MKGLRVHISPKKLRIWNSAAPNTELVVAPPIRIRHAVVFNTIGKGDEPHLCVER